MFRPRALALAAAALLCPGLLTACGASPHPVPSPPRAASLFHFSVAGHNDFYRWDGVLVRRADSLTDDNQPAIVSGSGHFFVDSSGRVRAADGTQVGSLPDWHHAEIGWSTDERQLCEVAGGGHAYSLKLVDFHGHGRTFPLDPNGAVHDLYGCDPGGGRAAVLDGSGARLTILSLSDGRTIRTVPVHDMTGRRLSPDVHWLADLKPAQSGPSSVAIIDLTDGHTRATVPGDDVVGFSPDGQVVVVTDSAAGTTRAVTWKTGAAFWSHPGRSAELAVSDAATDSLLLEVAAGPPAFAGGTIEFWIIDGRGAPRRFAPQVAPPSPSPAPVRPSPSASPVR